MKFLPMTGRVPKQRAEQPFKAVAARPSLVIAASLLALTWSEPGRAGDLVIDSDSSTPVSTSEGDGAGPGDIEVASGATLEVPDGAAITLDSNNSILNNGVIRSRAEVDGVGIRVLVPDAQPLTGTIENSGRLSIGLFDPAILSPMGPATGILVEGGNTFFGSITNNSLASITTDGENSFGIRITTPMVGDITNFATLSAPDANSTAISIEAPLTGNIINEGTLTASGENGIGIHIQAAVTGTVINRLAISTGQTNTFNSVGTAIPPINGGTAILVGADITGGILNAGNGLTATEEIARLNELIEAAGPDADRAELEDQIGRDGVIANFGAGRAIQVSTAASNAGDQNVLIGPLVDIDSSFGIVNRGGISINGGLLGIAAGAIEIEGSQVGDTIFTATIAGGIHLDGGGLAVTGIDAQAFGIRIGNFAIAEEIRIDGDVTVTTFASQALDPDSPTGITFGPGGNAFGLLIEPDATVRRFSNSDTFTISASGANASVFGVLDRSGTLTDINNSGVLAAIPGVLGAGGDLIAFDLSASTSDVNIVNTGTIIGDILLGSGNDLVDVSGGNIGGNISFGAGDNTLIVRNGSFLTGSVFAEGGSVNLDVRGSSFQFQGITDAQINDASFDGTSRLILEVTGGDQAANGLSGAGTVLIEQGAKIELSFTGFTFEQNVGAFIEAQNLIIEPDLEDLVANNQLFLFNTVTAFDPLNPNRLNINLTIKPTDELGLTRNQGAVFQASFDALVADQEFGSAIINIADAATFKKAADQLLPDTTGANLQIAIESQSLAFSAIDRRVNSLRQIRTTDEILLRRDPSERSGADRLLAPNYGMLTRRTGLGLWIQEIAYIAKQEPFGDQPGYDGFNFGVALGADLRLSEKFVVGISFTQLFADFDERGLSNREISSKSSQFNLYTGFEWGKFFGTVTAGFGLNDIDSSRTIELSDLTRHLDGNWDGDQIAASARLGYSIESGNYYIRPAISGTYIKLEENSFTETADDDGVSANLALEIDDKQAEIIRGSVLLAIGKIVPTAKNSHYFGEIHGGLLHDFGDSSITTRGRFVAGGSDFVVTSRLSEDDTIMGGISLGFSSTAFALSVDYDAQIREEFLSHGFTLNFRMRI